MMRLYVIELDQPTDQRDVTGADGLLEDWNKCIPRPGDAQNGIDRIGKLHRSWNYHSQSSQRLNTFIDNLG